MNNNSKRKFQDALFPEGIYLENNEFRTTRISTILSLIQSRNDDDNEGQSILAGEGGFEPLAKINIIPIICYRYAIIFAR